MTTEPTPKIEIKPYQIRIPVDLDRKLAILTAVNGEKSKNKQILALIREATKNLNVTI